MAGAAKPEVWWPFGPPAAGPAPRLLCLPYAGGGASVFGPWRRAAGHRLQVCPAQLPGREARIRETPFRRMAPAADAFVEALGPRLIPPYAFFGYSMGALVAFEVTHRLASAGLPAPEFLFAAAATPPHRRTNENPVHALPEDAFRTALRRLNGTPETVLEHAELMELLGPTLRADFEVCETYAPPARPALNVPIVAFGGTNDPSVSLDELHAWADLTRAGFSAITFPAHHFFLESHSAELLREVMATLAHSRGARPPS